MKNCIINSCVLFVILFNISTTKATQVKAMYDVKIVKDQTYLEPEREEKFDLYTPADLKENQKCPGIVIIHGGGWQSGDKTWLRQENIGKTLASHGYVCISINYLLSKGQKTWPVNLHDCKKAVQFLRVNAEKYHIDPDNIGVIGGSAGGHLSAMVGVTGDVNELNPAGLYKGVSCKVQAVVDLYGVNDFMAIKKLDDDCIPNFLGATKDKNPEIWKYASPVSHITKNDPPFLIMHGTADTTVDLNQSIEFDKKLRAAGVESKLIIIEGAPHTFHLQPKQKDLRPIVLGFFDKHLKN